MNWPTISVGLGVTALVAVLVAAYVLRQRNAPGAAYFGLLLLAAAEWALLSAFEKLAIGLPAKILLAKLEYFGIMSLAPLWLLFALHYTRRGQRLARGPRLALWVVPLLTLVLVWTNESHGLIWPSITPAPEAPQNLMVYEHGPAFYLAAGYTYLLLLAGSLLLLRAIFRWPHLYRQQAAAVLIGLAVPWVSNAFYLAGVGWPPGFDPTPLAFTVTGWIYSWAVFRYRLLDVLPVAREALLEGLPDGVFVLDDQGRVVDVNPAGLRLLSTTVAQVIGQPLSDLAPPLAAALAGEAGAAPQDLAWRAAGENRHFSLNVAPLAAPDGQRLGTVVALHDVTARRQADAALRASEARFEIAFESAAIGMALVGVDGRFIQVNKALSGIVGYSRAELLALDFQTITHPEDLAADLHHVQALLAGEREWYQMEKRYRHRLGHEVWILLSATLVRGPEGTPEYFISQIQDISERKQAEITFRGLLESAPDAMVIVNPAGAIVLVNSEAERLFGYERQALLGQPIERLIPDRFRGGHPEHRAGYVTDARTRPMGAGLELFGLHHDGHEFPVEISLSPIATPAGLLISSAIRDTTERKRVERRIEAFSRLAQQLNLMTTPKEAARVILEIADSLLGWDAAYLDLYSEERGTFSSVLTYDLVDGVRTEGSLGMVDEPPTPMRRRVIKEGGQLVDAQTSDVPLTPFGDTDRPSASLMFVPIRHGTRVKGFLSIQSYTPRAYTSASLETLQALADLTAGALDRIRAQAELQQSEMRNRYLIEHANDLIFETDAQGNLTLFNPKVMELLQYPADELRGRSFVEFVHPAQRPEVLRQYRRQFFRKLQSTYSEVRALARDGTEIWLGQNVQSVFDGSEIVGFQVVARDVTRGKLAEEQLRHLALHDALTGLPNRLLLMDRLERAFEHGRRHPEQLFAVLYMDLDRFKHINDNLGHHFGDQLLAAAARRLVGCLREEDTVARLGGDEFVVLLEAVSEARGALVVAERLLAAFAVPFEIGEHTLYLATSLGLALSGPGYQEPEEILRDADIALYRAKALGKGRLAVFDEALYAQAAHQLALETDLRHALERGEFGLVYQPIVRLGTGQVRGFEALLRWHHPTRGLLLPGAFLNLAEEIGLLGAIDGWVLREACQQAQRWRARLPAGAALDISVNLSRAQFQRGDLAAQVTQALADSGLSARHLCLEVTETVMVDQEGIMETLAALHGLGVRLHVDDFGTGYSSLRMLHQVPFDVLKVDRAFVQALDRDEAGTLAIVRTVLLLARELGRDVIAEGIETESQRAQLVALGCTHGQGFLFARPLAVAAAEALLADTAALKKA